MEKDIPCKHQSNKTGVAYINTRKSRFQTKEIIRDKEKTDRIGFLDFFFLEYFIYLKYDIEGELCG